MQIYHQKYCAKDHLVVLFIGPKIRKILSFKFLVVIRKAASS